MLPKGPDPYAGYRLRDEREPDAPYIARRYPADPLPWREDEPEDELDDADLALLARAAVANAAMEAAHALGGAELDAISARMDDPVSRVGTGPNLFVGPDTAPTRWSKKTPYRTKQIPAKQTHSFDRSSIKVHAPTKPGHVAGKG